MGVYRGIDANQRNGAEPVRRPSTNRRILALLALPLTAMVLTGCSGTAAEGDPDQVVDSDPPGSSPASSASPDGFPTCDEVKSALGSPVDGLVEIEDSENGVTSGADGPSLGCSWYTTETANGSTDLEQYGFISVGVSHDDEYTEESMESLGWNVDDARVAGAGAWALKVGGGYNPADQLDATGVQVVRDGVVVVLTSGGAALQDVPQLASMTNEWALGAGVSVLELTR